MVLLILYSVSNDSMFQFVSMLSTSNGQVRDYSLLCLS